MRALGARRNTDLRNERYRITPVGAPRTVRWPRFIPVIDQGDVGSCVGQAYCGALGSGALWQSLSAALQPVIMADPRDYGEGIYSDATAIDPFPGEWPGEDTGTDTRSGAQVLLDRSLVQRYDWLTGDDPGALALDIVTKLAEQPLIIGIPWFDSFDWPDSNGVLTLAPGAEIRGGHALVVDECNVEGQFIGITNSWGAGWGIGGRCYMSWATLQETLTSWGDACVPIVRTTPTPAPKPWWKRVIDWFRGWLGV